jgi:hypothetical protein
MAGRLQNEDHKSAAELVSAGGTAAQLINDTKIYSSVLTEQLSAALTSGDIANKSTITTKGDLAVSNGTTLVRLGVGSNTQVLTADSTTATGLKWAAAGGGSGVANAFMPFRANGPYIAGTFEDGLFIAYAAITIVDVIVYNLTAGTGGTTEFDVRVATLGGSFTSIFSTTPKITSSAAANVWIRSGQTVTGCTAPIFTSQPFSVSANQGIRVDLVTAMTGSPKDCGVILVLQ